MTSKSRTRTVNLFLQTTLVMGMCVAGAQSATIFVDTSATGSETGLNWTDAYTDLQDALEHSTLAAGDEIWVAAGTYIPTERTEPSEPDSATFSLVDEVKMYGGFAGGESLASQRDPSTNITILSGDVDQDDDLGSSCCTAHVGEGCDNSTCEGIVCDDIPFCCSPAGAWVDFCALLAREHCGLCNTDDNVQHVVTAENIGNSTIVDGLTITGAVNHEFTVGGGMFVKNASPVVARCHLTMNIASRGAGAYVSAGAGESSSPQFINCVFSANCGDGGGVYSSIVDGVTTMTNCLFYRNFGSGAAISVASGDVSIINCSITDNIHATSAGGGGVYIQYQVAEEDSVEITNTIVWNNTAGGGADEDDQVRTVGSVTHVDVSHTCIMGLDVFDISGSGNIGDDPEFVDPDSDDFRLLGCSPCIDEGDGTSSMSVMSDDTYDVDQDGTTGEPTPDLDLADRFIGVDGVGQSGDVIDMGAYEFEEIPCSADLNDDDDVDSTDLALLLGAWGSCSECDEDLNGDDVVGPADLAILLGNWGPCEEQGCTPSTLVVGDFNDDDQVDVDDLAILFDNYGCTSSCDGDVDDDGDVDADDVDIMDEVIGTSVNDPYDIADAMDDVGLVEADWTICVSALGGSEEDSRICWMDHYLNHCDPTCQNSSCSGSDPYSAARH